MKLLSILLITFALLFLITGQCEAIVIKACVPKVIEKLNDAYVLLKVLPEEGDSMDGIIIYPFDDDLNYCYRMNNSVKLEDYLVSRKRGVRMGSGFPWFNLWSAGKLNYCAISFGVLDNYTVDVPGFYHWKLRVIKRIPQKDDWPVFEELAVFGGVFEAVKAIDRYPLQEALIEPEEFAKRFTVTESDWVEPQQALSTPMTDDVLVVKEGAGKSDLEGSQGSSFFLGSMIHGWHGVALALLGLVVVAFGVVWWKKRAA